MTTPPMQLEIERYASSYEKLTGLHLNHRGVFDSRTQSWFEFIKAGFSLADLELVILFVKRHVREDKWSMAMLRFSYLIERLDRFEEWLAQAKAESRNLRPPPTHKEAYVYARIPITGPVSEKCSAVPIATVLAAMRNAVDHPTP